MTSRARRASGSAVLGRSNDADDYRLEVDVQDGDPRDRASDDPYRFLPTLGEIDLHLIGEGRHEQLWTVLGAHVRTLRDAARAGQRDRLRGLGAERAGVRVAGDFNSWDGRAHPMRSLGSSGVWELFVPGVGERRAVQVRHPAAPTACGGRRPTRWPSTTEHPPATRLGRVRRRPTSGATTTGSTRAPDAAPHDAADERLRGAPRVVATRAVATAQLAERAGRLRRPTSASPTSSCCP